MGDKRVYIMDVYNRHIYPGDRFAKGKFIPTSVLSVSLVGMTMPLVYPAILTSIWRPKRVTRPQDHRGTHKGSSH